MPYRFKHRTYTQTILCCLYYLFCFIHVWTLPFKIQQYRIVYYTKTYIWFFCNTTLYYVDFFPIEPNGDKFLSLANLVALFICSYTACIVFYTFFKQIHLAKPFKWYLSEMGKYTLALYLLPLFFFTNNFEWTNCYTHALINIEALGIAIVQSFIAYSIAKIIDEIPYIQTFLLEKQ